MLIGKNKELVSDCRHLKERMNQAENKKRKPEVVMRELQRQWGDTLVWPPRSEALLAGASHCHISVQGKTWYLKKTVNKYRSWVEPAPQETLEQLTATDNASFWGQMELRIKDVESELSKKTSQENSIKTNLEKYKQLYLEELKFTRSSAPRLNETYELLAEINTTLSGKKQSTSSLSSLTVRPGLEPTYVGIRWSLLFNRLYSRTIFNDS